MSQHTARGRPASRRLASIQAVAAMYDVSPKTVRRWIATGLVTGFRVGDRLVKVDLNEVEARAVEVIPAADAG
jgi:transposase